MLEPFARDCYPGLSDGQQETYRRLLTCEDQDLYHWFLGRGRPADEELAEIVETIVAFARRSD